MTTGVAGRASVAGAGLIGGSIGRALRDRGWVVSAVDADPAAVARGIELGAFDHEGLDPASEIAFVSTPVGAIVATAHEVLAACPAAAVTDVGSVKASVVSSVVDPRFVGGHPMAGSERLGVEGAEPSLFEGAAWVLTPGPATLDTAYARVREVVTTFGAEVLTIEAARHDSLVAVVSHVPHLTAAALVHLAQERVDEHRAVLRLAAGGFRDMTRIAAGSPSIWPDICEENQSAIVGALDELVDELRRLRTVVAAGDRGALLTTLTQAQAVRRALPSRVAGAAEVREVRIPVRDRPGEVAAVATLATELGVNLMALQTVDDVEGVGGALLVLVAAVDAAPLAEALQEQGYHPVVSGLEEAPG